MIAKVKEIGSVSKLEVVGACGYVSKNKDGTDNLNFTAFYEERLGAKGVAFGGEDGVGLGDSKLAYAASVQGNGNLLIDKALQQR